MDTTDREGWASEPRDVTPKHCGQDMAYSGQRGWYCLVCGKDRR